MEREGCLECLLKATENPPLNCKQCFVWYEAIVVMSPTGLCYAI